MTGMFPATPLAPSAGVSKVPKGSLEVPGALTSTNTSTYWGEFEASVEVMVMRERRTPVAGSTPPGLVTSTVRTSVPEVAPGVTCTQGWSLVADQFTVPVPTWVTTSDWAGVTAVRVPPSLTAPKRRTPRSGTRRGSIPV